MKCFPFIATALLLGVACGQPAHAADRSGMAGIAIDQPVALDECPERQGAYLPDDRSTCFKWPAGPSRDADTASPPTNGRILVNVALPDRPDYMSGSDAVVQMKDGHAVSVSVRTHGFGGEGRDFSALKDVFGDTSPRYLATSWSPGPGRAMVVQTSLRADWTLPEARSVYFNSTEFGVHFGLVRLQSDAAPAHQNGVWD